MKYSRIYLNPKDKRSYIDTYIADMGTHRDAILIAPGGAYHNVCSEREGEPVALAFLERGYNAFVLNYRVGESGDVFPCQLFDAGRAMLYIRSHAEELCINPERVFAVGFSAGGHLIGSISTMFDFDEVREEFGEDRFKIRPTGAILSYPVTTLLDSTHINSFKNLLGKPNGDFTEEERHRYSIEENVNENSAPMFIWHTVTDDAVPVVGSINLARKLAKCKLPFMMSLFPYGIHGIGLGNDEVYLPHLYQPIAAEWVNQADAWMKTLKNY